MKVLSVRQPYAALLVTGQKRIEARTWSTPYRGTLLIHASSSAVSASTIASLEMDREFIEALAEAGWTTKEELRELPRSAIIGAVHLVDVVPSEECEDALERDFVLAAQPDPNTYFWRVTDPVAIEPIPIDGKLKLWDLPSELESVVEQRMSRSGSTPAWRRSHPGTEPLRLFRYAPSPELAASIGPQPRSRTDIWNDFNAYVDTHALRTGRTVKLDECLGLLSPGKKMVRMDTLIKLVVRNMSPLT